MKLNTKRFFRQVEQGKKHSGINPMNAICKILIKCGFVFRASGTKILVRMKSKPETKKQKGHYFYWYGLIPEWILIKCHGINKQQLINKLMELDESLETKCKILTYIEEYFK